MIYELTFFVIHAAAAIGFVCLYRKAPCWMQKIVVILFSIAMLLIAGGYVVDFAHSCDTSLVWWGAENLKASGRMLLNLGALLYVFRLYFQDKSWKQLSAHYRPLPD